MGWLQPSQGTEARNVDGREVEEMTGNRREEADGSAIDALDMAEEQREAHEVARTELVGQSLQRHGNTMGDPGLHEILLEFVNVRTQLLDLAVLEFRDPPNKNGDANPILGEYSRHRLAQEGAGLTRNLKTPVDCVVVGEGEEIHPGPA